MNKKELRKSIVENMEKIVRFVEREKRNDSEAMIIGEDGAIPDNNYSNININYPFIKILCSKRYNTKWLSNNNYNMFYRIHIWRINKTNI